MRIVAFKLGGEEYGLEITSIREIVTMQEITRIPNASPHILGIINLRGKILTVYDMEKRLGLEKKSEYSRIMIAEGGNRTAGIAVNSVSEIMDAPEIQPPPAAIAERIGENYLKGVCVLGERLLIILDADKLLSEEEKNG